MRKVCPTRGAEKDGEQATYREDIDARKRGEILNPFVTGPEECSNSSKQRCKEDKTNEASRQVARRQESDDHRERDIELFLDGERPQWGKDVSGLVTSDCFAHIPAVED